MIITICSKFGTRGLGVAVSVGEGVDVDATVAGFVWPEEELEIFQLGRLNRLPIKS
jgi:hypothetical protein